MGNSLYEPPTQQGSSSGDGQMQTLPYCEGLEVGPKQLLCTALCPAAVCYQLITGKQGFDYQYIMMLLQQL
jgi:hypothetical protein